MATSVDFLASLGVNTHMDALASGYGDVSRVNAALSYLGIGLVRDHSYDINLAAYAAMAAAGVRFDLIVDGDAVNEMATMVPLGASVVAFEGGNEVDIYPVPFSGVDDPVAAALAEQRLLFETVRSTPVFAAVPVLNQSIGYPDNYAAYAATLAYSDAVNVHAYAAGGQAPGGPIGLTLSVESGPPGLPVQVTEAGYSTARDDPDSVDLATQAKYTLDIVFDTFAFGVSRTYLYELLDEGSDPAGSDSELNYGLFFADGSPKPAATALHNLTSILRQDGPVETPAISLAPTLAGLPPDGNMLALTGPTGSAFVAVWAEPQIWNADTHQAVTAAVTPLTLQLGTLAATIFVYDPLIGTAPVAVVENAASVTLAITDHPLIVRALGTASASGAKPPASKSLPAAVGGVPIVTQAATVAVYRFFDKRYGTHFFTASASERATIEAAPTDLVYEGVGLRAIDPAAADPDAAPVFRFFDTRTGTHFYTASASERDSVVAARSDLGYEGIGFYVHTTALPGDQAVYRFFDTRIGTHFYTADTKERAAVLATRPDLADEGIGFYLPTSA